MNKELRKPGGELVAVAGLGGESSLTRAEDSWTMVGEARLKKFDLT